MAAGRRADGCSAAGVYRSADRSADTDPDVRSDADADRSADRSDAGADRSAERDNKYALKLSQLAPRRKVSHKHLLP